MIRAGKGLIDIFYPAVCPLCGEILQKDFLVCTLCQKKLPFIGESKCRLCGKMVPEGEMLCGDCLNGGHYFDVSRALFLYNDVMRKSLSSLKYKGRKDIGKSFGKMLAYSGESLVKKWQIDVIVPVPVHKSRLKKRGYNQAAVIAGECSEAWHIPLDENAVIRCGKTKAMKELDRKERMKNLENAFSPGPSSVENKSVLIIDDIYTTGSTMDAVSKILKKRGALFVGGLVICIGQGIVLK